MTTYYDKCKQAADYIKTKFDATDAIGITLGSGLGDIANEIENPQIVEYKDIPNFPVTTVPGHVGRLILGTINGVKVLCMQGRFHYYEGHDMHTVTMYVRVMKLLGVKALILTNAAGGINFDFKPGTLMVIDDFINYMGINPLIGENDDEFGPRFPDMTTTMTKEFRDIADECAKQLNINLKHGVYMSFTGPSFETPAEIKFARMIGADACGMSTVPECIIARHCGLPILGISCITNLAAGMSGNALCHEEVQEIANKVGGEFRALIKAIIQKM